MSKKETDKSRIVKCRYKHCLHESPELEIKDAVKKGNCYYHPDCLETQSQIKEIIDLFVKHVNPNPVFSQLQTVINTIVFKKNVDSSFLLFGLKYYIKHKIPLNYPQGLYYVIQNQEVKKAYALKPISAKVEIQTDTYSDFNHKKTKVVGFQDIIK